jgi:hypothetical protein
MHHWTRKFLAIAGSLLLTGCLWGPGKFNSDLTLRKDGTFVLDYRGEIVLQIPPDANASPPWKNDMAKCQTAGKDRPCTPAEIATQKSEFEAGAGRKRQEAEQMAKIFGLPGLDDASNRAFAAKLMKYAGWRSVTYRGNGVFDADYHFEGRATQDFLFPALPDNDLLIPFIAIRRRADGSILVTAPALTGGAGALAARAGASAAGAAKGAPVSRAQGRFTIVTDGEILTNNSEEGAAPHAIGRQLHWDVGPASNKIPETLIRL